MDYQLLANIGLPKLLFDNKTLSARDVNLEQDTVVFKSGDTCGAFLIVISGGLRVDLTTKSGKEIVLYRMQAGDTCIITTSVLLNYEHYYARAITETPVSAIAIPAADFYTALEKSVGFSNYILRHYSQRMSMLLKLLDRVASKDILFELSTLLLNHRDDDGLVKMKQDSIAKEIGTAREVISRKLSSMEEQGIVKTHRGKIEILNLNELEAIAND